MAGACGMHWERSETQIELQWGNMKEGDFLEDLGVGGRVISRWIIKKQNWRVWTEFIWHGVGKVANCGEEGNTHLGSIKCGAFCK